MSQHILLTGLLVFGAAADAAAAEPQQTQQQTQQQVQQRDQIYGSQLMTPQERLDYRNRMRAAKTQEERDQIRLEHHRQMQERAKARGVTLPDEPPARPGRMGPGGMGPGGGMQPGGGMGPGGGRRGY
jgi:hypothetical protein